MRQFLYGIYGRKWFSIYTAPGGAKGFLKPLDPNRLGFLDFKGNKQYITVGNLAGNNKVSIILVDYPTRTRLKILARAEIISLNDDPALFNDLLQKNYGAQAERIIVLHIEAYDWNCPQHITPRYTLEEIALCYNQ